MNKEEKDPAVRRLTEKEREELKKAYVRWRAAEKENYIKPNQSWKDYIKA